MTEEQEKREHERMELHGHIADVADGNFVYGGIVEDVSRFGVKLNSLPTKFAVEGKLYCIVISRGSTGVSYKLTVRPRWKRETKSGLFMDIGFKVVDAPWEWTEFVKKIIPVQEEEDIWDQFSSRSYLD